MIQTTRSFESLDFYKKRKEGKDKEIILDNFFSTWYEIEEIPLVTEKEIFSDRIFTSKGDKNFKKLVEYKADFEALNTGNFFVETYSVVNKNIKGWFHTSRADWLAVLVGDQIFLVEFSVLRYNVLKSKNNYKIRNTKRTKINNYYYSGMGLLMPLKDLEKISNVYKL